MNSIILTGGGTAGHVTPNLALIPDLRKNMTRSITSGRKTVWNAK
ncbi:MAG: glycosyltransferase [Christensenellales bacterium]